MKKNKAGVGGRAVVPTLCTLIPQGTTENLQCVTGYIRFSRNRSSVYCISHSYLLLRIHSFTVLLQRSFG